MPGSEDETKKPGEPVATPGMVIQPGTSTAPVPPTEVAPPAPEPQIPQPAAIQPAVVAPEQPNEAAASNFPQSDETEADELPPGQAVTWTASEFIAHDKSFGWYLGLAVAAVAVAVLIYLITRDAISVAVVIGAGLLLGYFGSHKPRQLECRVDDTGVTIGTKHHGYEEFKSFSVVPEGAFSSIALLPLKRFAPLTTIYYPPESEEKIMAVLSIQLPYEQPRRDAVDSLMRRIRF